jgi:hypothetical protein
MILYDVLDSKDYTNELKKFVKFNIMNDDHKNKKNYNFFLETSDLSCYYHRFTMLVNDSDIVSIQGIRHSNKNLKYPENICRIADRHYVNKKYRISHAGIRTSYYTNYCLKNDINFLINNISNVDTVFISIEGTRGNKFFKRRQLKQIEKINEHFTTDEYFYQTCSNLNSRLCWQNCLYKNIRGNEDSLNLPKITSSQWNLINDNE